MERKKTMNKIASTMRILGYGRLSEEEKAYYQSCIYNEIAHLPRYDPIVIEEKTAEFCRKYI